jgi:hypothetical protein
MGVYARKKAEQRALAATGKNRIRPEDWYPELERLSDNGLSNTEIAIITNLSTRRIQQIRASDGLEAWNNVVQPPKERAAIDPKWDHMLERNPDAFKAFFEHFSTLTLSTLGYEMITDALGFSNCMINVPPRHAKTMIIAVWLPIWLLVLDRNEQVIIVSDTNFHAKQVAAEIAGQLEFNKEIIDAFGRFAPKRTKDAPWRPSQGEMVVLGRTKPTRSLQYSILSRGQGQQILGREATWAILDDITTSEITESETQRQKLLNWVQQSVFSRLEQGADGALAGHALVVGQRVHLNDLYGELESEMGVKGSRAGKKLWHVVKHPAVIRWPDEDPNAPEPIVLWPEKWSFEALMESYDRMGNDAFEKMYQQNPLPEGSRFVEPGWWEGCRDRTRLGYQGIKTDDPSKGFLPVARVLSFDPSPTKQNAMIAADVVSMTGMFGASIIEASTWKGNMREFIRRMDDAIDRYQPDYVIIERSTVANWLIQDPLFENLKRKAKVLEHTTGVNKGDPEMGILSLAADIEAGRIRLPYGDQAGRDMSRKIEDQATVYGHKREDDLLMALWFIKWNYRVLRPRGMQGTRIGGDSAGNGGTYSYIKRALRASDSESEGMRNLRRNRGR